MIKFIKIIILVCLCCTSCFKIEYEECNLYIYVEHDYKYEIDKNFLYLWDGNIGYSEIKNIYGDIIINDTLKYTKAPFEGAITVLPTDVVSIITTNIKPSSYEITTDIVEGEVFQFLEQYPIYKQPTEIWSSVIDNLSCNINKTTTVYTTLQPQSFIYLVQIIIHNTPENESIQCDSLILSGVSNSRNIRTGISHNNQCNIIGEIKPGQRNLDKCIFASRILSFGLPSSYQTGSSWDISETLQFCAGFKIILSDGSEKKIKANISNKMKEGGLITIELDYSDLLKSQNNGGFNIEVGEWIEKHIKIII